MSSAYDSANTTQSPATAKARGSIVIVGLGLHRRQITTEVIDCLRGADVVFHSTGDQGTRAWLNSITKRTRDLNPLYEDGQPRLRAYRAMAQSVVEAAQSDQSVVMAVSGHPCLLHTGVQLTLRAARERHIPLHVLPGISSIDGLLTCLGIDPGFGGLHVLEATDMVTHGREAQIDGHVVIMQVACVGPRVHRADGHSGTNVDELIRLLLNQYSGSHRVLHFRLGAHYGAHDLVWTTVAELSDQRWSNASSLYLPPAQSRSPVPAYEHWL